MTELTAIHKKKCEICHAPLEAHHFKKFCSHDASLRDDYVPIPSVRFESEETEALNFLRGKTPVKRAQEPEKPEQPRSIQFQRPLRERMKLSRRDVAKLLDRAEILARPKPQDSGLHTALQNLARVMGPANAEKLNRWGASMSDTLQRKKSNRLSEFDLVAYRALAAGNVSTADLATQFHMSEAGLNSYFDTVVETPAIRSAQLHGVPLREKNDAEAREAEQYDRAIDVEHGQQDALIAKSGGGAIGGRIVWPRLSNR
jgi:hypothetical protein